MRPILLIIPFWDVEHSKERSENIPICKTHWDRFSDFCRTKGDVQINVQLYNLGNNPYIEGETFIRHSGYKYRFEKPTRMNNAFFDALQKGYEFGGMCDPDVIIFEDQFEKLHKTIVSKLSPETMLTFGFSRTKPELREHLDNLHSKHPLILEATPYYERMPFCGGLFFLNINTFIKCGGFNEDFRVYGFDDVEFTNRWKMAGYKVSCCAICLYHLWHPTVLGTAAPEEIERYSYELKYWKRTLSYFQKWERSKKKIEPLSYLSPTLICHGIVFDTPNPIQFCYSYGKVDLYAFPKYIQKAWGLIPNDSKFYNEKLLK